MMGKITSLADKAAGRMEALQARVDKFAKGVKNAASEVPGLNRALELVTNPYIAVTAGVVGLGAGLVGATNMALDFEKGMAQVNVTAQLTPAKLAELRDELIGLGKNSTVPLAQIPGAFNQVISAVGDTQQALDIFGPALKASEAGFTDIKVVAEAVTNVLGSVGNATPTQVFDTLFKTMNLGKAEFADIASYLPKIIPLANNVGISYTQVAAAFAVMTKEGQSSEQAAMLLQNAMTALSKSEVIYGSKSKAGFERSGIAIFDHAGKVRALTAIVDDLSQKTGSMTDKQKQAYLAGLGLDAQAAAAFSIMAQHSRELSKFTGETANASGAMAAAMTDSANTSNRIYKLWQQIQGAALQVGNKLLPYVSMGLALLEGAFTWVGNNLTTIQAVAEGVGAGILVVLGSMAASVIWTGVAWVASMVSSVGVTFLLQYALLAVRTALFSIPIVGWIALGVAGFITLYQSSAKFRAILAGIAGVLVSLWEPIKLLGVAIANIFNPAAFAANLANFIGAIRNLDIKGAFNKGYDDSLAESAKAAASGGKPKSALGSLAGKAPAAPTGSGSAKLKEGIKSVSDSGRSVRNVVINITNLMKDTTITVGAKHAGKSDSELQDFITETIIRAVAGAEQALIN